MILCTVTMTRRKTISLISQMKTVLVKLIGTATSTPISMLVKIKDKV